MRPKLAENEAEELRKRPNCTDVKKTDVLS